MKIGLVGCGLIGGSILKALQGSGHDIYAWDQNDETNVQVAAAGLAQVDSPDTWAGIVDAVVLGVPMDFVPQMVSWIVPLMNPGSLLVDLSSIKRPVGQALAWALKRVRVLSLHLMAGREISGFEQSDASLFRGCPAAVVDVGGAISELQSGVWWCQTLGAQEPTVWGLEDHDAAMAWVSHLPYLVSQALGQAVAHGPHGVANLAGPGFRDTTRVGRTDPSQLEPFLKANAAEVRRALAGLEAELHVWQTWLASVMASEVSAQ